MESKSDASPVTEADRQAEEAMRAVLQEHAPTHAVFGEEGGMHAGEPEQDGSPSGYLWVLDPIDGTKSFITGRDPYGCSNSAQTPCGIIMALNVAGSCAL